MCCSCADFASNGRANRRCEAPSSAAAAARSNHAVSKLRSEPLLPSPVPGAVDLKPAVNIPQLQQLVLMSLDTSDDEDDVEDRLDATARLVEEYDTVDLAVAAIGARMAERGEELAGITEAEILTAYESRLAASLEEYEMADEIYGDAVRSRTDTPALTKEYRVIQRAHSNLKSGNDPQVKEQMRRLTDGYLAALAEVVPMGGTHDLDPSSHKGVEKSLNDGARCYPSSWVKISNSGQQIRGMVARSNGNPHYLSRKRVAAKDGSGAQIISAIAVDPSEEGAIVGGLSRYEPDAIHEQMHRYENVVEGIMDLENMFLDRRNTLPDGTLEPLQKMYGSGKVQTRPDHFTDRYTGRRYEDGASELMSTGMEGIFGGKYGGFIGIGNWQPDTEMRNFVLGVLLACDGKRGDY